MVYVTICFKYLIDYKKANLSHASEMVLHDLDQIRQCFSHKEVQGHRTIMQTAKFV